MSVQENHAVSGAGQAKIRVASIQMQVVSAEPFKNMVRAEGCINDAGRAGAQPPGRGLPGTAVAAVPGYSHCSSPLQGAMGAAGA